MVVLLILTILLHSSGETYIRVVRAPSLDACQAAKEEAVKVALVQADKIDARCVLLVPGDPA